jgi:hypothetical protein
MQSAVNTTLEEEVFSVWFAYIHCWATDVFSMGLLRDYICGIKLNQIRMRMRTRMERALGSQGRRVRLKIVIDCDYKRL